MPANADAAAALPPAARKFRRESSCAVVGELFFVDADGMFISSELCSAAEASIAPEL